jgi:hypothetical protein
VFDRSFNGSSFDAHDGPVLCCHAVPLSNDCQTVAAHKASGGKSTERMQLQLHARENARAWTKTRGNPDNPANTLHVLLCAIHTVSRFHSVALEAPVQLCSSTPSHANAAKFHHQQQGGLRDAFQQPVVHARPIWPLTDETEKD